MASLSVFCVSARAYQVFGRRVTSSTTSFSTIKVTICVAAITILATTFFGTLALPYLNTSKFDARDLYLIQDPILDAIMDAINNTKKRLNLKQNKKSELEVSHKVGDGIDFLKHQSCLMENIRGPRSHDIKIYNMKMSRHPDLMLEILFGHEGKGTQLEWSWSVREALKKVLCRPAYRREIEYNRAC